MPTDLYLARRIQQLDDRIDELTREIDGLPKHIARIESRLASHKRELANTQGVLAENGKRHRQLEGQVSDFRQKISKLQDQMNGARTNEQFRAFQHEIQYCRDRIDQFEDRILDKMEEADALEESVAKAQADLKMESDKVAADVEEARRRIEADKLERDKQRAARASLTAIIDPNALKAYERVRRARGTAVTAVTDENCGACHVRLRPKFLQDLLQLRQGVLTCETCGLIVYLADQIDDGVPLEDPAWE